MLPPPPRTRALHLCLALALVTSDGRARQLPRVSCAMLAHAKSSRGAIAVAGGATPGPRRGGIAWGPAGAPSSSAVVPPPSMPRAAGAWAEVEAEAGPSLSCTRQTSLVMKPRLSLGLAQPCDEENNTTGHSKFCVGVTTRHWATHMPRGRGAELSEQPLSVLQSTQSS